jgi:hypothetical protein
MSLPKLLVDHEENGVRHVKQLKIAKPIVNLKISIKGTSSEDGLDFGWFLAFSNVPPS